MGSVVVIAERVCAVCGAKRPKDGALPYSWDAHLEVTGVKPSGGAVTTMFLSCSARCRAARGWIERKGVV